MFNVNLSNVTSFDLTIGLGGASVSGPISYNSSNGAIGNPGGNTVMTIYYTILGIPSTITATAGGGGGGDGGHPSSHATPGAGGKNSHTLNATVVKQNLIGCTGNYPTYGGLNGLFQSDFFSQTAPADFYSSVKIDSSNLSNIGLGGTGTDGTHNPNPNLTTPGTNGYARVYYRL